MSAYYNEIDPYCAEWLRNLIREDLIAEGIVDTRSIVEIRPAELAQFRQCHFFAGIGGWSAALRRAGIPDDRPVWTGSCPCQPFSLAGRQNGFADERHLWPAWHGLIRECRPAIVLGEQVASATKWLGLVRSDLETLGYAVGAIPVEAASAGADHLRDRYWFVGHDTRDRWGEGRAKHAVRSGRTAVAGNGGAIGMADADDAGSQGRQLLPECAGERIAGSDGLADAASERGNWGEDPSRSSRRDVAESYGDVSDAASEQTRAAGQPRERERLEWVIGADGKARRVKPGIRLLADGVPARVAKLRALGNAVDLRPAAAFIKAAMVEI